MTPVTAQIHDWFAERIPDDWGAQGVEVMADQDEILVVVELDDRGSDLAGIRLFRESTRDERMALAKAGEEVFGHKVSWGARAGEVLVVFTTSSIPVMTRLRLPERRVLDTLISAGVARSRSEALAWCVRLVGENEKDWISRLRDALGGVEEVRESGPRNRRGAGG
jgi:hypothetical protein